MVTAEQARAIMQRARQASYNEQRLSARDYSFSQTTADELTKLAELQVDVPHSIKPHTVIDVHVPAHTTHDDNGTADQETISLSHDLVDAPSVADSVAVFRDGSPISPDSVDFDADEVTVTTNGNNETYDVWYLAGDQAKLQLRISAPRNSHEIVREFPVGVSNIRDQNKDPFTFDPSHDLEGVVPEDYTIKWFLQAPYSTRYENESTGASAPSNMILSLPVWKGNRPIEGLPAVRKAAMR